MASILETIQTTITENIRNDKAVFVFSTDIACSSWAEWAVKNTGVRAVPRNRFKAWDKFKTEATLEKSEGQPIPGLLRKIFVENLMAENVLNPVFKKIISPEFAENSRVFTDWVCSILPSLKAWNDRYEKINEAKIPDEEDKDYKELYNRYSDFLVNDPVTHKVRENKLYEPAWETKKLFTGDKEYFIFFPEILDDYADYKEFFTNDDLSNLHVFFAENMEDINKTVFADYFTNSRTEFRKLCLQLRHIHETEKISWREIAVSIPDIDTYLPYIERDFKLYAIPYVVRSGRKITGINAGSIFTCIKNVADQDFSYESMRQLLTNSYVPWTHKELNDELIREGANRKCIINYSVNGKKIDVWKETLKNVRNIQIPQRYEVIRKWVNSFSEAKTFKSLRQAWFVSKEQLFDFNSVTEDSDCNLVLGHCLDKLDELVSLEEKYKVRVKNPFSFFINELDNSLYQPQIKEAGVNIFKYKVSATAAFKYQFVVDASQSNLSVMNTRLKFLSNEKRLALGIQDEDTATETFILLYAKDKSGFSCSQSTVNGFAIPHSRFIAGDNPNDLILPEFEKWDFPKKELSYIMGKADAQKPEYIYEMQTGENSGFEYYIENNSSLDNKYEVSENLKNLIQEKTRDEGKLTVSASSMADYFPCSRKWLFSKILDLSEDTLTTELFNVFDIGNIYHRVLEKFFTKYCENKEAIPLTNENGVLPDEDKVLKEIRGYMKEVYEETKERYALSFNRTNTGSPLLKEVMESQIDKVSEFFIPVLRSLCMPYDDNHSKESGFGKFKVCTIEGKLSDEDNPDYRLYGEIDGVFYNQKDYSIIDYKTKYTKGPGDCIIDEAEYNPDSGILPEMKDFQLPMYVHLLQNSGLLKEGLIEQVLFFSLKKAEKKYIVRKPVLTTKGVKDSRDKTVTAEQFQVTVEVFKKYAEIFASEILACKTFEPDFEKVKDYEHCANCTYSTICRTTYTKRGK